MRKIPAQSEINQEKFTERGESPTTHIHTQNIWIASSRTCAVIWILGYRGWRLASLLLNALQRKTRKMLHFPSGHLAGLFTTPLTQVPSGDIFPVIFGLWVEIPAHLGKCMSLFGFLHIPVRHCWGLTLFSPWQVGVRPPPTGCWDLYRNLQHFQVWRVLALAAGQPEWF